jgi:maltose alpha-D-glucosyltransferase/alpha-amylase
MPSWLKNAVFYEIYPQSFLDTNGDGIGDFRGIITKLDYIKELGCNAIWMNPCFDSPFLDAGYDVRDYFKAAPRYGTNDELKELFEEVHKRGMHIILDLVPGHTAIDCEWFKESCKNEVNEYTHRYVWTKSVWDAPFRYRFIRGFSDRDGSCMVNFFSTQPALNYGFAQPELSWQFSKDAPEAMATRQLMKDIMAFWLDMGCDGFRVDMAASLIKGDTEDAANIELWQDLNGFLAEKYPEAAMVSEWGEPEHAVQGGFHMDFLLHFGPSRYMDLFRTENPYFSKEGKGDIKPFVDRYKETYDSIYGKGYISIPSGNHDMVRIAGKLDEEECRIIFAFLMSMPGVPFVYYGDEIGMRYIEGLTSVEGGYFRTGSRSPMQWDSSKNAGFSTADAEKLYVCMDADENRPTVEKQMNTENSLWKEVQKLISLRKEHTALQSDGSIEFLYAEEQAYPFIYLRKDENERILVILNPKDEYVECKISENDINEFGGCDAILNGKVIYSYQGVAEYVGGIFRVPATSATWILLG